MRKSTLVLPLFVLLMFVGHALSAQVQVQVFNGSNCAVNIELYAFTGNCNVNCGSGQVTLAPGPNTVTLPCLAPDVIAASGGLLAAIWDPNSPAVFSNPGSGVKVGTGCGANPFGQFVDCQGVIRNAFVLLPNTIFIN